MAPILEAARPRFAACLRQHAAEGTARQMTVALVVTSRGRVAAVATRTAGHRSPALASCVEGAARRLRFPGTGGRSIRLAFPVADRPGPVLGRAQSTAIW
jgi:hypothetical protein